MNNIKYKVIDKRHGEIHVIEKVHHLKKMDETAESAPQGSEAWLAKRRNFLTASAIASVIGKNPYESRRSLMRQKLFPIEKGSSRNNFATAHGHRYELEGIKAYEAMTNRKVLSFGLLESLNDGENFLAGSPDGITTCGRLVEVKCPASRTPEDKVPDHYMPQVQTLLHILQLPVCDFVQYVPDGTWQVSTLLITEVAYDPNFMLMNRPSLVSFWTELNKHKQELAENGTLGNDLLIFPVKRKRKAISLDGDKPRLTPICVEGCKITPTSVDLSLIKKEVEEEVEEEEELEEGSWGELPVELLLNFNMKEADLSKD